MPGLLATFLVVDIGVLESSVVQFGLTEEIAAHSQHDLTYRPAASLGVRRLAATLDYQANHPVDRFNDFIRGVEPRLVLLLKELSFRLFTRICG